MTRRSGAIAKLLRSVEGMMSSVRPQDICRRGKSNRIELPVLWKKFNPEDNKRVVNYCFLSYRNNSAGKRPNMPSADTGNALLLSNIANSD